MVAVGDDSQVAEGPDVQVEREESSAEVRRLLDALPPAQRTVIEHAYLDGMTQQEIADALGVPLGTVKGRLRLGLAKLRAAWDAHSEPSLLATAA
jgi:RNA polymerase sigma-70 factor (ECF subfamily)